MTAVIDGTETSSDGGGVARRLPHVPALDALRGLAVLGVIAYHHDPRTVPGGWLGVSMFFTLSGFLIAGLLIEEHEATGRIDLRRFWSRRIRRLLPASLAAVLLALLVLAVDAAQQASAVLPDIRAAVLNVANWHFVAEDAPYAGAEGVPSPVQHYWSLAIEEQFYLVFPLVAAVALRRRWLTWAAGLIVVASLGVQLLLAGDVDRVYFGADTRAAELAVGVGLAIALPGLRRLLERRRALADAWGLVALAVTGLLFLRVALDDQVTGSGGLTAVTVVWAGLIVACVCGRTVPAVLARGPLAPIGRISYGIYLYHWPVHLVSTPGRMGFGGAGLLAFRFSVTVLLAAASNALLELPIRRRSMNLRPVLVAAGASVAAIVALTVAVPTGSDDGPGVLAATFTPPPSTAAPTPTSAPLAAEPIAPAAPTPTTSPAAAAAPEAPAPAPPAPAVTAPPRVPRLLVTGDSTAGITGRALQRVGAEDGRAEVFMLHQPGCATYQYDEAKIREGFVYRSPCGDLIGEAVRLIPEVRPDAIVVFIGSAQLFDARYDGSKEFRSFLHPTVSERYRSVLTAQTGRLLAAGVPVLWADVPTPAWDLDAFSETYGFAAKGTGPATSDDPARAALLNQIDASVMDPAAGVVRWGYTEAVAGPDGQIDEAQRPDGLHLTEEEAERLAREEFFDRLQTAYRTAQAELGGAVTAGPNAWSV